MRKHGAKLKTLIYPVAFLLIALLSMLYKLVANGTGTAFVATVNGETAELTGETYVESTVVSESESTETIERCSVYLCGEVVNPGVYEIDKGSILNDAVIMAGGLTPEADMTRVNLVYVIESNFSVYIPKTGEEGSGDNVIRSDGSYMWGGGEQAGTSNIQKVNINTADKDQLMTLPGIGEVTANAIISYREDNVFSSIEDIKNVTGIGDAKFNNIKDYITV
ncbi:MAG: helix-hairpin-helix domain-containing protein [Saccharofermentans sp.]|nr:helix-hairpin-helix domain-containing protein [Saccharofermentans sp.]